MTISFTFVRYRISLSQGYAKPRKNALVYIGFLTFNFPFHTAVEGTGSFL